MQVTNCFKRDVPAISIGYIDPSEDTKSYIHASEWSNGLGIDFGLTTSSGNYNISLSREDIAVFIYCAIAIDPTIIEDVRNLQKENENAQI